jgi:hypothetical protein
VLDVHGIGLDRAGSGGAHRIYRQFADCSEAAQEKIKNRFFNLPFVPLPSKEGTEVGEKQINQ